MVDDDVFSLFKYFLFLPFQHSILVMMIIFDMLWVHLSCEAFMFGSKEKKCFFFLLLASYVFWEYNAGWNLYVLSPYQCWKHVNLVQLYLVQHQYRKLLKSFYILSL